MRGDVRKGEKGVREGNYQVRDHGTIKDIGMRQRRKSDTYESAIPLRFCESPPTAKIRGEEGTLILFIIRVES
jgi:hypothetical protein